MIGKTTYTQAYGPKNGTLARPVKMVDNLKTRDLWIGDTTYGNHYLPPNPEYFAKRNRGSG
jgi:hypothetical protein